MRRSDSYGVYDNFYRFIEEFLLKGNSILTDHTNILNTTTIQNCFTNYIVNFDGDKNKSYRSKIEQQFKNADLPTRLVFAHTEWLWAFAVNDISQSTKRNITIWTTGITDSSQLTDVYPKGFGSAGTYHKNNKYFEIKFNLLLLKLLKEKRDAGEITTSDQVRQWIEKICFYYKYDVADPAFSVPDDFEKNLPDGKLAMSNILLYVSFPDKYERITSDSHKWQIVTAFSSLLTKEEQQLPIDERIILIRQRVEELIGWKGFDFYDDDDIARVWNYSLTEEGFSEVQGLLYKKAIILYGPPGTSKTHTARNLANALITHFYLKKKENLITYFKENEDFTGHRIHRLQLHPNYNYEDFIAGMQLKKGETVPTKGKLFDICTAALRDKDSNMPHVLILDEINRIDLSRLFGEVFSALEERGKAIEVGIKGLKLTIPENLYIIGTMNEIDFSLERVDFALQRRFLWFFYGFNKDILIRILRGKAKAHQLTLRDEEVNAFVNNAKALNTAITKLPELGEQFQIGHTFFGEIVDIYKAYKEMHGFTRIQKQIYRSGGPAAILWDISILPILNAFLGNMDTENRKEKISELKQIYFKD